MSNIIRAVAFQQGDVWIVQGVEYDIVAQTKDPLDAPDVFREAVIAVAMINAEQGRAGLEDIQAAPEQFQTMFEQATKSLSDLIEPPAMGRLQPKVDLRVYRRAA